MFKGLWKSSGANCSEHNEEVFPRTHIFLLSNTKLTHFFRLFFKKNGILCIDVLLSGSYTLPQRAATHLSGIFDDLNKSQLGKKRCDRPNWYKFLKLRHHTSRILSGWEETNVNGGLKWRQISKVSKNHLKMFCSVAKFFSQKFLFKCVLSVKKIIFSDYGHFRYPGPRKQI